MAASKVCSSEILKNQSGTPENCDNFQTVVKIEDVDDLDIDLSVKCRGCFAEDPKMHYLFAVFDQDLSLADILMETTAVEVNTILPTPEAPKGIYLQHGMHK